MWKARLFDFTLFTISIAIAYSTGHILTKTSTFMISLFIYWLFSCLYYHLRVISRSGQISIEDGINYALSFVIFTGPLGLFIYECAYYFIVYIYKWVTKRAEKGDFLDSFYNIGSFVLGYSIAYYLYQLLYPAFHSIPFGIWILICLLTTFTYMLTHFFLTIVFFILGEFKTIKEAVDWNVKPGSLTDIGTLAFTNGLLLLLLQEEKWEMIIGLFLLNYFINRSFIDKSLSVQHKMERDQFKKMAYTDFLTGISNRAYMGKMIAELNKTEESIGIVVCDIDKFKQINDNYNHAVGDQVIQSFVHTVKFHLNKDDYLFRSGGEEFTIFLRNKTFDESVATIDAIQKDVASLPVEVEFNDETIQVSYTTSFGLYYHRINEEVSVEKGYIYADNLLLESKQCGRNKVSVKNGLIESVLVLQ